MNILKEVVGVIGSIILVYYGARFTATVIDFCQHRYRTLLAKGSEGRIIPQLSFWSELESRDKMFCPGIMSCRLRAHPPLASRRRGSYVVCVASRFMTVAEVLR
jgi:hypothetical protein